MKKFQEVIEIADFVTVSFALHGREVTSAELLLTEEKACLFTGSVVPHELMKVSS